MFRMPATTTTASLQADNESSPSCNSSRTNQGPVFGTPDLLGMSPMLSTSSGNNNFMLEANRRISEQHGLASPSQVSGANFL